MLFDKRTTFAEEGAIGGSTGRRLVGDVIDLGEARDIGVSDIWLYVLMTVAGTSGGSATMQLELASDAQAAIATDASATVHLTSPSFAVADLTAGKQLMAMKLPLEVDGEPYERYLGILANVGTAALTAGSLTAFLTFHPPVRKIYPNHAQ